MYSSLHSHADVVRGFMVDSILALLPMVLSDVAEHVFPMDDDDMGNCAMLDVLAADWEGQYQAETLYKTFSLSEGSWNDEWAWEEIDNVSSAISAELNAHPIIERELEMMTVKHGPDDDEYTYWALSLGFGTTEGSCDWGLLITWNHITKNTCAGAIDTYMRRAGYTSTMSDADCLTHGGMYVMETHAGEFHIVRLSGIDNEQTFISEGCVYFDCMNRRDWVGMKQSMDTASYLPKIASKDKANARLWLASDMCNYTGMHTEEHVRCVITSWEYPDDVETTWQDKYEYSTDVMAALEELTL